MDEMKELVAWWKDVFNKERLEVEEILWAEAHKHSPESRFEPCEDMPNCVTWEQDFNSKEQEAIYKRCMDGIHKLEENMDAALEARLHRIIPLIPSMWT